MVLSPHCGMLKTLLYNQYTERILFSRAAFILPFLFSFIMTQFRSLFAILFLALLSAAAAAPAPQTEVATEPTEPTEPTDPIEEDPGEAERRPGRCHRTRIRKEW